MTDLPSRSQRDPKGVVRGGGARAGKQERLLTLKREATIAGITVYSCEDVPRDEVWAGHRIGADFFRDAFIRGIVP